MSAVPTYPVRAEATLDPPLSRWLWLVKWLAAIPHYVVLVFLWLAFVVLSIVARVAILFTGRYPRSIFDLNLGVLRWTWRVHYYTYSALATDRYPPFTLAAVPDYPATLEVAFAYPERLSRARARQVVAASDPAVPGRRLLRRRRDRQRRARLPARADRRRGAALHRSLPTRHLRLRHGHEPLGAAGDRLRGPDDHKYPPFRLDLGGEEPDGAATHPMAPAPAAAETL